MLLASFTHLSPSSLSIFPRTLSALIFSEDTHGQPRNMGRITIDLVRKRSEHNEGEIRTIKELSLHQQKLDRIENLDRWCRELEILLLQSNSISKIENVSRLKCLKYLNLALNNIEVVEGLQGCESLQKLDLTLNFIGQITSVKSLVHNIHLEVLYLTGNPCSEYPGYREYIIAVLPKIKALDGEEITKTTRLRSKQCFSEIEGQILQCEKHHQDKREGERRAFRNSDVNIDDEDFWTQSHPNTPEVRALIQRKLELEDAEKTGIDISAVEESRNSNKARRYFKDNGRALNINDGKYPIRIDDEPEKGCIVLDIGIPKHLDTSLISVDVQPTYARVIVKQKIVQICLSREVRPDSSTIQRSTTTGVLVLTMPMLDQSAVIQFQSTLKNRANSANEGQQRRNTGGQEKQHGNHCKFISESSSSCVPEDACLTGVVNEDEVPPLE